MSKVPAKLRLGKKLEGDANELQKQLDDMYSDIAPAINTKVDIVRAARDPGPEDKDHDIGTFWLNTSTTNRFQLTDNTPTWTAF